MYLYRKNHRWLFVYVYKRDESRFLVFKFDVKDVIREIRFDKYNYRRFCCPIPRFFGSYLIFSVFEVYNIIYNIGGTLLRDFILIPHHT